MIPFRMTIPPFNGEPIMKIKYVIEMTILFQLDFIEPNTSVVMNDFTKGLYIYGLYVFCRHTRGMIMSYTHRE